MYIYVLRLTSYIFITYICSHLHNKEIKLNLIRPYIYYSIILFFFIHYIVHTGDRFKGREEKKLIYQFICIIVKSFKFCDSQKSIPQASHHHHQFELWNKLGARQRSIQNPVLSLTQAGRELTSLGRHTHARTPFHDWSAVFTVLLLCSALLPPVYQQQHTTPPHHNTTPVLKWEPVMKHMLQLSSSC